MNWDTTQPLFYNLIIKASMIGNNIAFVSIINVVLIFVSVIILVFL